MTAARARHARLALLPALLAAAACKTLPYQPATMTLEALPDDAFDRALDVVRAHFRAIEVADRDAFRIQTAWTPHQRGDNPGEMRATVFCEGRDLAVVVETRWLALDLFGWPRWSAIAGDPFLERELLAALASALNAPEPPPSKPQVLPADGHAPPPHPPPSPPSWTSTSATSATGS